MPSVVSIQHVSKIFSDGFKALDGVDLEIKDSEILALLGPNGAGKTTLISIICGISSLTTGKIQVDGYDVELQYRKAREMIGLVPQEIALEPFETVMNSIRFSRGLFGKPKNEDEAFTMLKELSGKKHEVITSISIKSVAFQKIINDITTVYFKEITDEEINYYVKNYKPFDKAGAYGIQEWLGFIAIHKMEGSYFNVVGLPIHKLYKELIDL